jgi:hypothetical protein
LAFLSRKEKEKEKIVEQKGGNKKEGEKETNKRGREERKINYNPTCYYLGFRSNYLFQPV